MLSKIMVLRRRQSNMFSTLIIRVQFPFRLAQLCPRASQLHRLSRPGMEPTFRLGQLLSLQVRAPPPLWRIGPPSLPCLHITWPWRYNVGSGTVAAVVTGKDVIQGSYRTHGFVLPFETKRLAPVEAVASDHVVRCLYLSLYEPGHLLLFLSHIGGWVSRGFCRCGLNGLVSGRCAG